MSKWQWFPTKWGQVFGIASGVVPVVSDPSYIDRPDSEILVDWEQARDVVLERCLVCCDVTKSFQRREYGLEAFRDKMVLNSR